MKIIVLAATFALTASTSLAQTGTAPLPDPTAPSASGEAVTQEQGGPANLCQELLAFMKAPPETAETAAAKPAADKPAALKGTTGSGDPGKAEQATGSAQKITGQEGVATDAPEPGKDNAASGSASNAPQKESRAAPVPPEDVTSTPKETVLNVTRAEELAAANDIAQCQKAAREMRVAGVSMPPPLIALTALDLKYQQKGDVPPGAAPSTNGGTGLQTPQ